MQNLSLQILPQEFSICRLTVGSELPNWVSQSGKFVSMTCTQDEISIVAESSVVPSDIKCTQQWRALQVCGQLDFALVGILAGLTTVLAQNQISVFAISTYDTDYLFVKAEKMVSAAKSLQDAGYHVLAD